MPPAAEFVLDRSSAHESSTSLDVFGNDLGDVDVWGDEKPQDGGESSQRVVGNPAHREHGTENHGGVPKPPRTARQRELSAELLQKHGTVLKNTARRSRRPSLTESGKNGSTRSMPDSTKSANAPNSLPPMTPRTRSRKLGVSLAPMMAPPIDASPKVKTLSVAEKRRLRSEELSNASSKALNFQLEDDSEPEEFTVNWTGDGEDAVKSQSQSQRSLFQELQTKAPTFGHTRNHSDSELAFNSLDLFNSTENKGFDYPSFVPDFNKSEITACTPESKSLQRAKGRESRKEVKDIVVPARSQSIPRKIRSLQPKKPRKMPSDHQATAKINAPNQQQKRRSKSDAKGPSDELQKHLRSLFSEFKNGNVKNSTHSGSTKSSKSGSRPRKDKESSDNTVESDSSPIPRESEDPPRPSSFSRRRREPPREAVPSPDSGKRSSSVPRAGQKIRLVRNNTTGTTVNNTTGSSDARSTGERSSAKSRASSKSSKSPRSGRRASLGDSFSANASPRRRRPPACPPSPATRSRSDARRDAAGDRSPVGADNDVRRSPRPKSPGKGRVAEGGERMTPRTSGTPRRKIRYIRNNEGAPQTDALPIPNLG